jgi:tripartite-type tricarboxylate transporter receptor subunit TctC
VVARLNQVLNEIVQQPAMQQALGQQGYSLLEQTPQQFAQQIQADMQRYALLSESLGLKVD